MNTVLNVYMEPSPSNAIADLTTSINSIVVNLNQHFHKHGIRLVEDVAEAGLVASHAGMGDGNVVIDVSILHGMMWTGVQPAEQWAYRVNGHVINTIRQAKEITVPSEWVADVIRRDLRYNPEVIPWAVNHADFKGAKPDSSEYVLWNKTRNDFSTPAEPLERLARMLPDVNFLSTFGEGKNIRSTGRVAYPKMVSYIKGADIYLATTLETFGIGTLEALAAGVPVIGFNWGGTSDLVQTGVNGYLVEPGDYEGLVKAYYYCKEYRDILSKNAVKTSRLYSWEKTAGQFAEVFKRAYAKKKETSPKVSVVIPVYNYARYVDQAIKSVSEQEYANYEVIVVNDSSTDESLQVATQAVHDYLGPSGIPARVYTKPNGGVASARNYGIQHANGEYILCLDADDKLGDSRMLRTLASHLDTQRELGIVYTGLELMAEDGSSRGGSAWPGDFDYDSQVRGANQIPTCCMFRKEAWRRAGKYKTSYEPAEDAELWLGITTFGYSAKQVTKEPWFKYRLHDRSLSARIRGGRGSEPDWHTKAYLSDNWRPFAAWGRPPMLTWPVRYYIHPVVTVIIPVGPGHEGYVSQAIESVYGQTYWQWELIVVDDSGSKELTKEDFPFARIITTPGGVGAGAARNIGLAGAKGRFVVFLDADDYLHPEYLEKTIRMYSKEGRYVYTDWLSSDGQPYKCREYSQQELVHNLSIHSIVALIPTVWARDVGGFDETLDSWEDSDFFIKMAIKGYCGVRLDQPLFTYRYQLGKRREEGVRLEDILKPIFYGRYHDYIDGEKKMCCGKKAPVQPVKQQSDIVAATNGAQMSDMVRVEYLGAGADHTVRSPVTGQFYGRRKRGDVFYVWAQDAEAMPSLFKPVAEVEFVEEKTEVEVNPPQPI